MVLVTCEKTGLQFEASSKRTKNHPAIMALLGEANRYGWYREALQALERGREQQFSTLEQFTQALRNAEASVKEVQANRFREEREREEAMQEARRQRAITTDFLREHGYRWQRFENDEEDQDFFNAPAVEWDLRGPDRRIVSVKDAMLELAFAGVAFAKLWLAQRNIPEEMPSVEKQRQEEAAKKAAQEQDQRENTEDGAEMQAYRQEMIEELLFSGFSPARSEQEADRLCKVHSPLEDVVPLADAPIPLAEGVYAMPAINGDVRYGVLINGEWCGIEEVLSTYPDIPFREQLLVFAERNKKVRAF